MGKISSPQGKGSQMHNRREYEKFGKPIPDNIDVSKSSKNITLVDKDLKEAYHEIFGEALEKYNGKQKRADRKIESYYDHIQKSKNGEKLFYENVVQWGSKDDFTQPETREKAKTALMKYAHSFEEINPNLKLIGAYIHMDEASPHLHIDYVPVATGYKTGMSMRNSLDRAMKQMGFLPEKESRKNNATKLWKESQRAYFAEICQDEGLEVEAERKSTRKDLSVEEYKDARDEMLREITQEAAAVAQEARKTKTELDDLNQEIEVLESKKTGLQDEVKALKDEKDILTAKEVEDMQGTKTIFGGLKGVSYKDFEALKRTALDRDTAIKDRDAAIKDRDTAIKDRDAAIKDRDAAIKDKNTAIRQMKKKETERQEAEKERQEAEKRAAAAEATIDKEIAKAFRKEKIPPARMQRLENFCKSVVLVNKKTVLEAFEDDEKARQERIRQQREAQAEKNRLPTRKELMTDIKSKIAEKEKQAPQAPQKKKSYDLER